MKPCPATFQLSDTTIVHCTREENHDGYHEGGQTVLGLDDQEPPDEPHARRLWEQKYGTETNLRVW